MKQKKNREKQAAEAAPAPATAPAAPPCVKVPLSWRERILECNELDTHVALLLLMFCKKSGSRRIVDCRSWNSAHWLTYVGVSNVRKFNTPYWRWDGQDLVVLFGSDNQKEA